MHWFFFSSYEERLYKRKLIQLEIIFIDIHSLFRKQLKRKKKRRQFDESTCSWVITTNCVLIWKMLLANCARLPPKKKHHKWTWKILSIWNWIFRSFQSEAVVKIKRNVFFFISKIMKRSLNNISFIKMIYHTICVGSVYCRHFTCVCVCAWAHWLNLPTARTRWECQKNKTTKDKTQYIFRMERKKKKSIIVITTIAQTLYTKKNIASGAYKSFCYSAFVFFSLCLLLLFCVVCAICRKDFQTFVTYSVIYSLQQV